MSKAHWLLVFLAVAAIVGCPTPTPNPNAPTANFTATPLTGAAPLAVAFSDTSTAPDGLTIRVWTWDFGDGQTSSVQNPAHTYAALGSYTVRLTVSVSGGIDSEIKRNYITVTDTPVTPEPVAGEVRSFANMSFVWIPSGNFYMGATRTAVELSSLFGGTYRDYLDELPQHKVTFSSGFWMGQNEVTQAQWRNIMNTSPSSFTGDNRPVENVTWNDCQDFVTALNKLGKGVFALPTEAQWEYACRAKKTTEFYFGDSAANLDRYAWYSGNSNQQTHNVGLKLPNAWNLYDMHGNVIEWCQDRYYGDYTGAPTNGAAWTTGTGTLRVLRSGSWFLDARYNRSATRINLVATEKYTDVGLRLVRKADAR